MATEASKVVSGLTIGKLTKTEQPWDTDNASSWYRNQSTELQHTTDASRHLNLAALPIIGIIILVAMGNVLVIIAVCLDRKLRSATNCFLTSLAVADLLVALTVMPPSLAMIINNYVWPFSDELCGIWVMLDVFFSTSSILHLCMISLDRYLALARPFHHRQTSGGAAGVGSARFGGFHFSFQHQSKKVKRVATRICLVWTVALGIALPIPIIGKKNRNNLFVGEMCAINVANFQIFGSLVAFFLPLVIMFIMYTLTIQTLRKQAKMVSSMLVHSSCKNSPLYPSRKQPSRRPAGNAASNPGENDLPGRGSPATRTKRRESAFAGDEGAGMSESLRSILLNRQLSNKKLKCDESGCCEKSAEEGGWMRTAVVRPVVKAMRQMRAIFRVGRAGRELKPEKSDKESEENNRCACSDNEANKEESPRSDRRVNLFPRKYRSSVRRISSSFKNRAMASISNEQRASKVLGLIFILFCVFWCPFFITNVVSRLCTTCNQELMGECMNWFVWVGYVSSGVNPCVYTLFSRRFRETFSLLVRGKFRQINQRKLTRSFSSHETSCASQRSCGGSGIASRPSKGSMRPSMAQRRALATMRMRSSPMSEETWLRNVRSATSMKAPIKSHNHELNRGHSSECVTTQIWRSSWHAKWEGGRIVEVRGGRQVNRASSCDQEAMNAKKSSSKQNKRTLSESDAKQQHVERAMFVPAIEEAGETTWLAKEEDFSSLDISASSMDSVWSNGQNSNASSKESKRQSQVGDQNDNKREESEQKAESADAADETVRLLSDEVTLRREQAVTDCQCPLPEYDRFAESEIGPTRFGSRESESDGRAECVKSVDVKRGSGVGRRKVRLTREDSGMGASFDTLLPHNLPLSQLVT